MRDVFGEAELNYHEADELPKEGAPPVPQNESPSEQQEANPASE